MTDQQLDQLFKEGLAQKQAFDGAEKQWALIERQIKSSKGYSFTISMLLLLFGSLFLMFYLNQHTKPFSQSTNIIVKQEKPSKYDNLTVFSEGNSLKEKESINKLQKNNVALIKDNHLTTNKLKPLKQENAFSTLNEKHVTNQHPKNIKNEIHSSKEKKLSYKIEEKFKSDLAQNLLSISDKIVSNSRKYLVQKSQIENDDQAHPKKETTLLKTDIKKPFEVVAKEEIHIKTPKKLNSIQVFLTASQTEKLNRTITKVAATSIFSKKNQNKKWTILAGLSFKNLLNQLSNTNVKDSSSIIRNFGLHYTANNKFTIGLHYKFNTVAKKIKRIEDGYNLPELPSLSGSENARENISLIYESNLFNLLLGYQIYKNERINFSPFIGLQSGYFPSHIIKYGVNEVYDEQNLVSLIPAKFYWANDLLLGINAAINITSSISLNARYEYQLSLNNNYNWQTPHLLSTFIAVKF